MPHTTAIMQHTEILITTTDIIMLRPDITVQEDIGEMTDIITETICDIIMTMAFLIITETTETESMYSVTDPELSEVPGPKDQIMVSETDQIITDIMTTAAASIEIIQIMVFGTKTIRGKETREAAV